MRGKENRHCYQHLLSLAAGGLLLLTLPSCHNRLGGKDIDVPAQRPGRFMQAAAPAEQKAAREEERRQEQQEARHPHQAHQKDLQNRPSTEDEHFVPMPPEYAGGGTTGPIKTQNGHTVTPQTNIIYGAPPPPPTPSPETTTPTQ